MSIKVISLCHKQPTWVRAALEEYTKRMSAHLRIKWLDLPLEKSKVRDAGVLKKESDRMLKAIEPSDWVVALDVQGKSFSSEQFAKALTAWREHAPSLVFIIGGAEGLSQAALARANAKWSLSALTFPHQMVKILLAEQLYRAQSIAAGHPYHK